MFLDTTRGFTTGFPVILKFLEPVIFSCLAILPEITLKFSTYPKFPKIHII